MRVLFRSLLAYGVPLRPTIANRAAVRAASLGYAVPGSVIAVGVLIPFGAIDNAVDAFFLRYFGFGTGLVLTGTIAALVFAYLVRFLAISYNTIEASLGKISPSMDQASPVLVQGTGGTLMRVPAPIQRGGMLTAGRLDFVHDIGRTSGWAMAVQSGVIPR